MMTDHKKLSELTMEFQFVWMLGNMVLLRNKENGVIYQGNRQKCSFYEGIYTTRQPPKQENPLALIEDERDEYLEVLKSQFVELTRTTIRRGHLL